MPGNSCMAALGGLELLVQGCSVECLGFRVADSLLET